MPEPIVQFKHYRCRADLTNRYAHSGRIAISLYDDEGPVATATVNIPEEPLGPGEVLIKSYSENEGMTAALVRAGLVEPPTRHVQAGYCTADVCRLTPLGLQAAGITLTEGLGR